MNAFRSFFRQSWGRFPFRRPLPAIPLLVALWASQETGALLQSFSDDKSLSSHFQREVARLQSKYGQHAVSFPQVQVKKVGSLVQVEFPIDQRKCDLFSLMIELFRFFESIGASTGPMVFGDKEDSQFVNKFVQDNDLGTNSKANQPAPTSSIKAFSHGNIQVFKLSFAEKNGSKGSFTLSGEFRVDRPSFRVVIQREGGLTKEHTSLVTKLLEESYKPSEAREARTTFVDGLSATAGRQQRPQKDHEELAKELREMGLDLILPEEKNRFGGMSWNELGGYEKQKRDIEDTILLSLTHGEVYDKISEGTRVKFERNRPKTVLFEGPPGTGKTTSAKIIASMVNIPLVYVPAEAVLSKWFGDSEKSLAAVFEKVAQMGRAIIFIDEIDSLAVSRDTDQLHEASRRLVSTLLRKLDSFESETETLLICATNRKEKLDPALLSRVDLSVKFDLPDRFARKEIFKRYAKQLADEELEALASLSEGLSGRGILETCKDVERRWASMLIRGEAEGQLPPVDSYRGALGDRIKNRLF